MKTITVLEVTDFDKVLKQKVYYYFDGDKNFFQRKGINMPNYTSSYREEHLIRAHEAIENSTKEDFEDIKKHMCDRLDRLRDDLEKAEKQVLSLINEIGNNKETLKTISDSGDFKSAIYNLIR